MFKLDANDMLRLATKPQEVIDAPAKRRIYPGIREDAADFGDEPVSARLAHARRVIGRALSRVGKIPVADVCLMAVRESGWLARLEGDGVTGRAVAANVLAAVRHVRELSRRRPSTPRSPRTSSPAGSRPPRRARRRFPARASTRSAS